MLGLIRDFMMPSSSNPGSPLPFATFRRSILGMRNEQIHSMESGPNSPDAELESFQKQVFNLFHDLLAANSDEFLSLSWIKKLLDAYMGCQEEFRVILCKNRAHLSKPPVHKLLTEFFERSIKALDICNASREGIDKIRQWQKHLEIVISSFESKQREMGEGQFRRARKALMDLALVMLDEKETGSMFSQRNRSFGRHKSKDIRNHKPGHSRSLSWSVSQSWSAAKQLQSIAHNLVPPRGNEIVATNGLAVPIFTMGFVLMFVLWALVAAIPCQDRSLQAHFSIPRQFSWGTPLYFIHVRILDESKKRERKNSIGLMKEIYQIEKGVHHITELVDSAQFPLGEEQKGEVKEVVEELSKVSEACKNGFNPLERHLREVFRNIMSCRIEGLELLDGAKLS